MFKDPVLLAELKSTTQDLITENLWSIAFVREDFSRTPEGGMKKGSPSVLPEQEMYLGAVTIDAAYTVFWEGNMVKADYVIVGYWPGHAKALDIKEKDEFIVDNRKFIVVEVHPDKQYETRAWCIDRTSGGR